MVREKVKYIFFYRTAATTFLVMVGLPLALLFIASITENGKISFIHYTAIFTSATLNLMIKSCIMAGAVGFASVIAGGFFGSLLARTDVPFSGLLKVLLLLPLFVSPYYLAVAWRDLIVMVFKDAEILKSIPAVGTVLFLGLMPVAMVILWASFRSVNPRLEEAGMLHAGRFRVMRSIVFPIIKPALLTSFALVFTLAVSEITVAFYYVVELLPTELFLQFTAFYNPKTAAALGILIIGVCFLILLSERSYLADAPFLAIGKKGSGNRKIRLRAWKFPAMGLIIFYISISVFIPLLTLGMQAFREPIPEFLKDRSMVGDYLPSDIELGYSMEFFNKALKILQPAMSASILYSLAGSLLACSIGFLFAYHAQRNKTRWMNYFLLLVFAIPSTLFGIALIRFYNRPSFEIIYTSVIIILIGYIGKFTFVTSGMIGNSIRQVPRAMEEAAMLAGARLPERIRSIVFPLIFEGFFSSFIICFIFCLGEIATTIVLYPPGLSLLPIKIATSMHNVPDSLMSAMVLIVLGLTFVLLALLYLLKIMLSKKTGYARNPA